jgi:hypothetical protein
MGMTIHQKSQILKVVEYYMTPELREKIMREVPIAYNAWMGSPVVDVITIWDKQSVINKEVNYAAPEDKH